MINKEDINSVDQMNPVDFFNRFYVGETFEMISNLKNVQRNGPNSLTYVLNKDDLKIKMLTLNNKGMFKASKGNKFQLEEDEIYTPFMLLQKFKFKDCFHDAKNHVINQLMDIKTEYIRVATDYYLVMSKTDRYGIKREELKYWKKTTITDDFGKDYFRVIPTFKDFCIVPNNKCFKPAIGEFYNLYSQFAHKEMPSKDFKGKQQFPWIDKLMNHIFGEQIELGWIYMKVLYDHPTQALPILSLLSTDRSTGKSTFVNFNSILWGGNSVIIGPKEMSSDFNGSYSKKNVILIEESHFDSRNAQEKLKSLATQKEISVNEKHIGHYTIPFFAKIIITSNDEERFNKIDQEEIRYWVRKVPVIQGPANHNVLEDMKAEIPAFLAYLSTLPAIDLKNLESRQVFTNEQIGTAALDKVKAESKHGTQKDIEELLDELGMNNTSEEEIFFTPTDVKRTWFKNDGKVALNYIRRIFKEMGLNSSEKPMRYDPLCSNPMAKPSGRCFIWSNPHYVEGQQREDENEWM